MTRARSRRDETTTHACRTRAQRRRCGARRAVRRRSPRGRARDVARAGRQGAQRRDQLLDPTCGSRGLRMGASGAQRRRGHGGTRLCESGRTNRARGSLRRGRAPSPRLRRVPPEGLFRGPPHLRRAAATHRDGEVDLGQHEMVDEVLGADTSACAAQYIVSTYMLSPPAERAAAVRAAIAEVKGLGHFWEPIQELERVAVEPLPGLKDFLPAWRALIAQKPAGDRNRDWDTDEDRWMREVVQRMDGSGGLAKIARTTKR